MLSNTYKYPLDSEYTVHSSQAMSFNNAESIAKNLQVIIMQKCNKHCSTDSSCYNICALPFYFMQNFWQLKASICSSLIRLIPVNEKVIPKNTFKIVVIIRLAMVDLRVLLKMLITYFYLYHIEKIGEAYLLCIQ